MITKKEVEKQIMEIKELGSQAIQEYNILPWWKLYKRFNKSGEITYYMFLLESRISFLRSRFNFK